VKVFQSIVAALPSEYHPQCSVFDQFFRIRSELIQAKLIAVEDKDPEFACALQKIVDEYKLNEAEN
jgi:hypothetical protein